MQPPRCDREAGFSPFFRINGKRAVSNKWKALVTDGFTGYRLRMYGLVENPMQWKINSDSNQTPSWLNR
jgi:hypothetical protein